MNFREELARELGLSAIAKNTMLDDYVKACEAIAVKYHKSEVEKLNIPSVGNQLGCDSCRYENSKYDTYCGHCTNFSKYMKAI